MIDREVIVGIRRAGELLPKTELLQMAGRCGRSYERGGKVFCIVPPHDLEEARLALSGRIPPIKSRLNTPSSIGDALASILWKKERITREDYSEWTQRTLSSSQGELPWWREIRAGLLETECIVETGTEEARLSPIGRAACRSGFAFSQAKQMVLRMRWIAENNLSDDLVSIAWLFSLSSGRYCEESPEKDEFLCQTRYSTFVMEKGEVAESFHWWLLFAGRRPVDGSLAATLKKDFQRRRDFLSAISEILGMGIAENLKNLSFSSAASLCSEGVINASDFF